jgi:hypothetical protein
MPGVGKWTWGVGSNGVPFRHDNGGIPIMVGGLDGTWGWGWGQEPYAWEKYTQGQYKVG